MTPEVSINLRPRYSVAVSLAAPGGVLVLKPPQDTLLAELQAIMRGPRGPAYPSEAAQAATEAARDAAIAAQGDAEAAQGDAEAAQAAAEAARDAAAGSALSAGNSATAASGSATAAAGSAATAGTQSGIATTKAAEAAASATTANAKAGEAAGSAAQALAIYGNTAAMNTALSNAQAAASAAAGSAASAASVLQQDLSAISAALHRSPNAITAMFIYDTSKDSDGGAWVEKCQHTSWYNEPLCGKWLGAQASEAAARAVSGATTGDYFQLTTDGKFYKLNAGAGTTEVFRGNKAKPGRIMTAIGEAGGVNVFDLTEKGQPMWRRWATTGALSIGNVSSIACGGGQIWVGGSTGVAQIDLAKDRLTVINTTNVRKQDALATTGANALVVTSGAIIVNAGINAVAMTVLPDAPTDVVTGLKVPTIAVATAAGVSVIKHDGTVVSGGAGSDYKSVAINKQGYLLSDSFNSGHVRNFGKIGALVASFTHETQYNDSSTVRVPFGFYITSGALLPNAAAGYIENGVYRFAENNGAYHAGLISLISSRRNTGYCVGALKRCYLSDIDPGSISATTELNPDPTFNTIGAWEVVANCTIAAVANKLVLTATAAAPSAGYRFATVAGRSYVLAVTLDTRTQTGNTFINISNLAGEDWTSNLLSFNAGTVLGTYYLHFVATAATTKVAISGSTLATAGLTTSASFVSLKEVVINPFQKGTGAAIYGTLTKALTASANQLVAYSGFSATNYLREPYSADLDFGTGEWSVGAWVAYSTAVASTIASRAYSSGASIKLGTDASGKLTATAYDGTTTRTVTTTAAYNTGTYLKAVAHYLAGRLSIEVNGVEVAATTGAPLLTMNNSNAVLTLGNSYALDAPFPGSIALLKLGATVPTPEQSLWMHEQEKAMFRDGAQITLPSSGAVVDLTYDEKQDKWVALQATHESSWTGLVRTAVATPSAGSFAKVEAKSGIKLQARTTTSPGVDITMPPLGLREELVRRAEAAAAQSRTLQVFDFDAVGFTAAMTNGSPTITASSIVGTPYIGMGVTGTGVPANTTILGINGTTYTLSANCTATASNAVAQSTFTLTPGWTATEVIAASASKREGATKDWVRLYDGFRETVRFAVSPGSAAWVQITARKDA